MRRRIVVSVIIPTYNYGHYVREAVESVLRQTYQDLEIFVIDDGSTDDTQEVLAAIRDARLRVIRTENRGISAARNEGLDHATGEYIAFLDADDRWKKDKIERQVRIMESEPTVCAAFTNFQRFNAERIFRDDQFVFFPELADVPSVPTCDAAARRVTANAFLTFIRFGEFPTFPPTLMFRQEMVSDLRFAHAQAEDGRLLFSEDGHYCFRAFRRGDVAYISDPLVEVRRHDSNVSKRTKNLEVRRVVIARMKLETLRRLAREQLSAEEHRALRKRTGRALIDYGRTCVEHGLHLQAVRSYCAAFLHGMKWPAMRQLAALPLALLRPQPGGAAGPTP